MLERAGLITRGREAQWRPSRIEMAPLEDATEWIERYREVWRDKFDRLESEIQRMKADQGEQRNE